MAGSYLPSTSFMFQPIALPASMAPAAGRAQPAPACVHERTQTVLSVAALGPVVGSARSVPA